MTGAGRRAVGKTSVMRAPVSRCAAPTKNTGGATLMADG